MSTNNALDKYAALYKGQNPANFMSIAEARVLVKELLQEGFPINGMYGNPVGGEFVPVEELLQEGFPDDVPFNLLIAGTSNYHNARLVQRRVQEGSRIWWWLFGKNALRMWW